MEVEAMKCTQCGHAMRTGRENYLYRECGLPNVTLEDLEISRCPGCGEHEAIIPKMEQLHRVIATAVARKVSRLTREEIRFLRKYLGWSGSDFAEHMGVSPETVSRWEHGSATMGPSAERLLRLAAMTREPASDYSLDVLKRVAQRKAVAQRLQMKVERGAWRAKAA